MKCRLVILIWFCALDLSAQQVRKVSGVLTGSDDGLPLPQVTILIKGTTTGTATDIDGYYSINAPIGSVLVFRYLGYVTQEFTVTETDLVPVKSRRKYSYSLNAGKNTRLKPQGKFSSAYLDSELKNGQGLGVLTDITQTLKNYPWYHIEKIKVRNGKTILKTYSNHFGYNPSVEINSTVGFQQVNRLPKLQRDYVQGRNQNGERQWRGPETGEIFSWGPAIENLEFNGADYNYDRNGRLVALGSGNGESAQAYDPYDQLRSGWFNNQSFKFWSGANYSNEFKLTANHRNSHGPIEGMLDQSHHITASVDRWNLSEETLLDLSMTYYQQEADLPLLGGNLSNLFSSIYRTPISFDNANGLNKRGAFKNMESYLLTNGAHRSHAPGLSDNPYGLINRLPDGNKLNRWNANLKLSQYFGNYNFELKGAVDLQKNKSVFGFPPGYAASANGILTNRDVNQEVYNLNLNQYYRAYISGGKVKLNLFYNYQSTTNQIDRIDFTNFTPSGYPDSGASALESQINRKLSRQSHELVFSSLLSLDYILSLNLSSNFYFSNTLNKKKYSNFFPSASLTIDLEDLFDIYIYTLELYVSASKSIKEEGLTYDNWAYRSTDMPVADYQSFYQSGELFFNDDLSPQLFNKLELGVKTEFDFWDIDLSYFYNTTADFIAPVKTADSYRLANLGNMVDKGFNAQIGFRSHYYGDFQWKSQLSWSLQRNKITSVNSDEPIPLAGFAEVQSQIAQGQPLGAIYGSTYQRNEQGQLIIGPDGFPIKNSALSLIGNPIPRFTLGLSNYIRVRRFEFSMTLDSQFGGDRWNGTRAVLDYLGRSSETGEDREIRDYVFPGVDANGNPNTIPINFADPSAAFVSNRWVRYGWDGVAEDYIEKATTLRISELSLGYGIQLNNTPINHMKITAVARNLLLYTSYSGVDTSSTLFGYLTGDGLDLFNSPLAKSYALQVTLNF